MVLISGLRRSPKTPEIRATNFPIIVGLRYASQEMQIRSHYLRPDNYRPFKVIQASTSKHIPLQRPVPNLNISQKLLLCAYERLVLFSSLYRPWGQEVPNYFFLAENGPATQKTARGVLLRLQNHSAPEGVYSHHDGIPGPTAVVVCLLRAIRNQPLVPGTW